jgi:hypothetical protein
MADSKKINRLDVPLAPTSLPETLSGIATKYKEKAKKRVESQKILSGKRQASAKSSSVGYNKLKGLSKLKSF